MIFIGNLGVGKTHTSIALVNKAPMSNKILIFITIINLITELKERLTLNKILLLIDGVKYLIIRH